MNPPIIKRIFNNVSVAMKASVICATLLVAVPCLADGGRMQVTYRFARTAVVPEADTVNARILEDIALRHAVDSVLIEGYASPDGPAARNAEISVRRAEVPAE